ncbi:MAG: GtrA family protein [Hydrogenophaga sp.]|uniref:GtrA family protein n=1 Tax=Hydrogenophaga sp. TaxID=1904254 RepID=UPI000EF034BB|nr:GtrA family protein [Hydrogenophaga sp.]MDD3786899.1 GtrA family protein [Hydrogenophaga sp.]HAJ12089.1 GtrA family protein [Comamonadaceae bacterium]
MTELLRFGVNGLVATAVHYGALTFNLEVLGLASAGLANGCAALLGIASSFIGSRYFVFRRAAQPWLGQLGRFGGLYASIALLHTVLLGIWSDLWGLDYRIGFLLATGVQVVLSYLGNKWLVFK